METTARMIHRRHICSRAVALWISSKLFSLSLKELCSAAGIHNCAVLQEDGKWEPKRGVIFQWKWDPLRARNGPVTVIPSLSCSPSVFLHHSFPLLSSSLPPSLCAHYVTLSSIHAFLTLEKSICRCCLVGFHFFPSYFQVAC
ncbi:hypothetical protein CEXT_586501 [Caerostris extrusa]|uniref:Uncharacterized protein n=1 Tax=Caerostris extrusa TaxID=172846 RepID=A0AAV4RF50_CAEEX|nr:hypothetical protein CEXT_586501 [Caerostris extrusa]